MGLVKIHFGSFKGVTSNLNRVVKNIAIILCDLVQS